MPNALKGQEDISYQIINFIYKELHTLKSFNSRGRKMPGE